MTAAPAPHPSAPPLDSNLEVRLALLSGDVDAVHALRGRLHWELIEDLPGLLVQAAEVKKGRERIRAGAVVLLEIALSELDRGGSLAFGLHAAEGLNACRFVDPVLAFIEHDFPEAIELFVRAGFDPLAPRGVYDLTAIDVAREIGREQLVSLLRSLAARQVAQAALEDSHMQESTTDETARLISAAISSMDVARVQELAGRLDWEGLQAPWDIVLPVVHADADMSFEYQAAEVRPALVELLRLALHERDRGGQRMFDLVQVDEEDPEQNRFPGLQPICDIIHADFQDALQVYLEAGFDPTIAHAVMNGKTAIEWATQADRPQLADLMRSYAAREEARRALQDAPCTGRSQSPR